MHDIPEEAVKAAMDEFNRTRRFMTSDADRIYAAVAAALPFLPVQGAVKKLEWNEYNDEQGIPDRWDAEASSFGVFYSIEIQHDGYRVVFDHEAVGAIGVFDTLEAAKAAAQADHEARILSALEPSAGRAAVLEEAAHNAAMYLATGFISCPRCGEDVETKNTDAEYTLRAALSSPDHADAGKVDGDGAKWPMREVVAKAMAYHAVGDPHARTIRGDQRWEWFVEEADKFISVFGYYLPSAPSQEVAGS